MTEFRPKSPLLDLFWQIRDIWPNLISIRKSDRGITVLEKTPKFFPIFRRIFTFFFSAKEKQPTIIFIDEIDAIGTKRFDSEKAGDREVQRTMLELLSQLDGFEVSLSRVEKRTKMARYVTLSSLFH